MHIWRFSQASRPDRLSDVAWTLISFDPDGVVWFIREIRRSIILRLCKSVGLCIWQLPPWRMTLSTLKAGHRILSVHQLSHSAATCLYYYICIICIYLCHCCILPWLASVLWCRRYLLWTRGNVRNRCRARCLCWFVSLLLQVGGFPYVHVWHYYIRMWFHTNWHHSIPIWISSVRIHQAQIHLKDATNLLAVLPQQLK